MFDTVLVANRGEIATRIVRTLRRMGIESVAVYTDDDADAPFVRLADRSVGIGATHAYLDIDRIVEAALATGSQALHPGYGFLSEHPGLARACADAGIAFVGPSVAVLERMGDKISAKEAAIRADVPVVPGRHDPGMDDEAIARALRDVGLPAILKPAAGGGGKGMMLVREESDTAEAIASARRVARSAFGDDTLLVERYVEHPRHLEVQILADTYGHVLHLGERECSLQRRHQKVIEEAPSVFLDPATREALCASAVRLAEAVGYVGAGTVEYVVPGDDPGAFAFLEMNTRLQVEHPVTEATVGLDLVEWQVRIAAGEALDFGQGDVRVTGHAVEARVYAEDAAHGFLPTGGEIMAWACPAAQGVRIDSGVESGSRVGTAYDPMIAKVIAHGATRDDALARLREALDDTVALGVHTNIEFLRDLLADADVAKGDLDTGLIERFIDRWAPAPVDDSLRRMAGVAARHRWATRQGGPFHRGDSWRLGGAAPLRFDVDGMPVEVQSGEDLPDEVTVAFDGTSVWLHVPGIGNRQLAVTRPVDRRLRHVSADSAGGTWIARSPMPGAVVEVAVAVGDAVSEGDAVVVVEAMKMEHALRAPAAGVVTEVRIKQGDQVKRDDILVQVSPTEAAP